MPLGHLLSFSLGQRSELTKENQTERKYLSQCHPHNNSTQTLAQITLFNG